MLVLSWCGQTAASRSSTWGICPHLTNAGPERVTAAERLINRLSTGLINSGFATSYAHILNLRRGDVAPPPVAGARGHPRRHPERPATGASIAERGDVGWVLLLPARQVRELLRLPGEQCSPVNHGGGLREDGCTGQGRCDRHWRQPGHWRRYR